MLLAAALLFLPHYQVTHSPDKGLSLTADAAGNAYVIAQAMDSQYLSKMDPNGNLIYRISPAPGQVTFSSIALDNAGDVYTLYTVIPSQGGLNSGALAKIDPAGKVLFNYPLLFDTASAMAVGSDGSIYLTGYAYPTTGPSDIEHLQTTPGAWISSARAAPNQINAFAMHLSAMGQLMYTTFLDGAPTGTTPDGLYAWETYGTAIAVDAAGNAYIAGKTDDPHFRTTPGAYQSQFSATAWAAFAVKLNPVGSAAVYSTFLPAGDTPTSIVPDAAGNAYLRIATLKASQYFGVPAAISTAQLNASGNAVTGLVTTPLNSFIGASPFAVVAAVPDGQGNILVTGEPAANGLPVSPGALASGTGFVAVIRAADGAILYSSRLPSGAGGAGIAPDGNGGFIVLGGGSGLYAQQTPDTGDPRPLSVVTRFSPASADQPGIFGVVNAAGASVSQGLAPGEIVSVYGVSLGPQAGMAAGFSNGALPADLSGTKLLVNGIAAPLLFTGSGQVNAIVPFETAGSPAVTLQLSVNGALSNTAVLPGLAAEPAIFAILNGGGTIAGLARALNQDGTVNSQNNPAALDSVVTIFVNGAGAQSPSPADGAQAPFGPKPVQPVSMQAQTLAGYFYRWEDCDLFYAGAAPGEVAGLLQVNFKIPLTATPTPGANELPIQVIVAGRTGQSKIWVRSASTSQ